MDGTGFDPANGSHWLLIGCFAAVSAYGLVLSWRWSADTRARRKWDKRMRAERKRIELSRRLAVDSQQQARRSLPEVLQLSRETTARWQAPSEDR